MRRKKSNSSFGVVFLLGLIIGGSVYLYNSAMFERNAPSVSIDTNGYWNLQKPLNVTINDSSGVKSYKITLVTKDNQNSLYYEKFINPKNSVSVNVESPRSSYAMKDKNVKIIVEATDASKWNFFNGNDVVQEFELKIDKKRPNIKVMGHSYKITRGGSAVVVFKATDDNLKDVYIKTNYGKNFKVQPFYKDGYYISLLAWPVANEGFKATVVATDNAGNISKTYIPLYLKQKTYRVSNIKLSNKFLHGKIAELAQDLEETNGIEDPIEQFKIINEDVRAKNEVLIHDITSELPKKFLKDYKVNKMYPLKSAQIVASFGDHRKYFYKGVKVSESYHLGIDLASYARAAIKPQNSGDVVYSDFNGLYGKMPIIHHGLGLYTLYGHCSNVNVSQGEYVKANSNVANTGKSGYAMGDHLHFGVLIQGIEVRPAEWMDKTWIKLNILDVVKTAKSAIDDE